MEAIDLEKLRYPIGKFVPVQEYTSEYLSQRIGEIASFPERLKKKFRI